MRRPFTRAFVRAIGLLGHATLAVNLMTVSGARADEFIEDNNFLAVTIDDRPVRLESLIIKSASATGRLPIAILAHGKESGLAGMLSENTVSQAPRGRDLARRGYLAVMAMRRGFGQSDGPVPVTTSCSSTSLVPIFDSAADDLDAIYRTVAKRPDADPTRVIVIGTSEGGAAAVAWGARNPSYLRAVVNLSGGLHFNECDKSDTLVDAFKVYGLKSRVPNLWLYADNDALFGKVYPRLREAFLSGGGDAKLVSVPSIQPTGHDLATVPNGRLLWLTQLDAFLRFHNLPTWPRQQVDSTMKKLSAPESLRNAIENYLTAPGDKAFAWSLPSHHVNWNYGGRSLDGVRQAAINNCQKAVPVERCIIVMEENDVLAVPHS